MPGLVPGIHVRPQSLIDVDGRDKPGHDGADGDGDKPALMRAKQP